MKLLRKTFIMAAGVALATSVTTVAAMKAITHEWAGEPDSGLLTSQQAPDASSAVLKGTAPKAGVTPVSSRADASTDFTRAAELAINGVVSIKSYVNRPTRSTSSSRSHSFDNFFNDPLFEFFFGSPRQRRQEQEQQKEQESTPGDTESADPESQQQQSGLGSGVIISPDGYIVTNNHVIDGADRLEITLNDNRTFNATVIGKDSGTDLALIKIEASGLPVITMGDSDALKVGEWVLAVGNPFGFTSTVTTGIVSAKARNISAGSGRGMGIESYIQTDAAVNPGNSGGALVNLDGELVGINAAIYSQTGNYAGYSFAIPTSLVVKVVDDIKQYGAVQRPFMGLTYQELTPKLKKEKGITGCNDGIYIVEVAEGKAAAKAGLKAGDVIIAINGEHVGNSGQLYDRLNRYRPGDQAHVTYVRDNKPCNTVLTFYNNDGSTQARHAPDASALGATFKALDADRLKELGIRSGLEVTEVRSGGLFAKAGIKKGYVILDINNQRVTSGQEVEKMYLSILGQSDYDHVMFITGMYPGSSRKVFYAVDIANE